MATERSVLVRLRANVGDFVAGMGTARAAVRGLTREIDTTNDRTAWLAQGILALAPAATTIGAVAIPGLMAMGTQATVVAGAVGTMALAFNGVGDALGALNDYQLEPTAANLEKLNEAMRIIGPDGAEFVKFLDSVGPKFNELAMLSRAGMFPGFADGIREVMDMLPQLERVVTNISEGVGQLAAEAGAGLSGEGFADFFDYIESEAKPILVEFGRSVGNFMAGFSDLFVAFGPLTDDFSAGMLRMSESFQAWADGLSATDGFAAFTSYIRDVTPDVLNFIGSLSDMTVAFFKAAAPVGEVLLPALTQFLSVIESILDSPLGPLLITTAAAMSTYGRAVALASITTGGLGKMLAGTSVSATSLKSTFGSARPSIQQFGLALGFAAHSNDTLKKSMLSGSNVASDSARKVMIARGAVGDFARAAGPAAATAGLLAVSMTGVSEKAGLSSAALGTMAGLMVGGPWGAAIGTGIGLTLDFRAANQDLASAVREANAAMSSTDVGAMKTALDALNAQIVKTSRFQAGSKGIVGTLLFPDGAIESAERDAQRLGDQILFIQGRAREAASGVGPALANLIGGPLGVIDRSFENAAMSAAEFSAEVERLNGILSGRADWRDYQAAIDAVAESLKENGRTLNRNTAAGRANEQALDSLAAVSLRVADGMSKLDRGQYLKNARGEFIAAARSLGMTEDAAKRLATRLGLLGKVTSEPEVNPKTEKAHKKLRDVTREVTRVNGLEANPFVDLYKAPFDKGADSVKQQVAELRRLNPSITITANNSQAMSAISAVRTASAAIDNYVEIVINTVRKGLLSAKGNFVPAGTFAYANGGMDRRDSHAPEFAGPGPTRIWREPETGGESYIPHRNDGRRPRAKSILEQTAALFGGEVSWYANGGVAGNTYARGGSNGGSRASNATRELDAFARALRKARGDHEKMREVMREELQERRSSLRDLKSKRNDFASSVGSSVAGSQFFGNGLAGLQLQLQANANDARAKRAALKQAQKRGLDGGLFNFLAEQGDLTTTQQLAGSSRAEIRQLERLYAVQNRSQGRLGNLAANERYSDEIRDLTKTVDRLEKRLRNVGKDVEKGARDGSRAGTEGRRNASNRETQRRTRAGR